MFGFLTWGWTGVAASTEVPDDIVDRSIERIAVDRGERAPLMRIGLAAGHRVELEARGGFRLIDPHTGATWRSGLTGVHQLVASGGPRGDVPRRYRVQVGAYADEAAARQQLEAMRERFGVDGVLHLDPDRGMWRLRLGEARRRGDLNELLGRLRAAGIERPWIADEPLQQSAGVRMRLVDPSFDSTVTEQTRLLAIAEGRGSVAVDGKRYRGVVELRLSRLGQIQPVNWIGLESYLRGVVPDELGPEVWPELEALKAQAVAARTYAWRNRGQFLDDGYDICNTPRCQVYGGRDSEHPLSDRAIAETRGQIMVYDDRPITAYYTATCGGHTEDGELVFPGDAGPYLKGVPSRADREILDQLSLTLRSDPAVPALVDPSGRDVSRDWALLEVAGVIDGDPPGRADAPIDATTLRQWTSRFAGWTGRPRPQGNPGPLEDLGQAAVQIVADLGWAERARWLVDDADLPALLQDAAALRRPIEQQRAVAVLLQEGLLNADAAGSLGLDQPATQLGVVTVLGRAAEIYAAHGLRNATFSRQEGGALRLVRGKGWSVRRLAPQVRLFGRVADRPTAVPTLRLWPGDRIRYRTDAKGRIDFLELRGPVKGTADDRSSRVFAWTLRKTRRELEASINRRLSVGTLQDLRVVRRGVSGRIVELEVVGSQGRERVQGFDIRGLFGRDLRDLKMVLEIERDASGRIEAVVLEGKGWGHGVGLCQVGAYGMALRGAGYREILQHYYTGVALRPLRPDAPRLR